MRHIQSRSSHDHADRDPAVPLSVLSNWSLAMDLSSAVAQIDSAFSRTLTQTLRTQAVDNDWPQDVADTLDVTIEGGVAHVRCPSDTLDYEYGTDEIPFRPIVRRFLNSLGDLPEYHEAVASTVWKGLGL